ncbi:hypothetical protein AOQ84DRAFT_226366 [Glonium stellatum]|uniref:Zn(2)-C6 fungal-type domain-containing protein n=1 Tax=Glonium stellatum TaxID=574774 RepID=A0A8E2F9L7_9PEZI|nr:hypothetical protein AOQ84DRAFT_226366 [Glonium stellatum]
MAPKRAADDDAQTGNKLPKTESTISTPLAQSHRSSADFSSSVKKKLSASTRTGQACDRCKIRKIRCDGRPGGCSPCIQNNTPCKTTDRITGRATTRGHTEALESENTYLRQQVAELQSQLKDLGVEVKPLAGYNNGYMSATLQPHGIPWTPTSTGNDGQMWETEPSQGNGSAPPLPPYSSQVGPPSASHDLENIFPALPAFKTGCIGDNYLGVSSADSLLSPIKGTSLSVFGTEIDIADFVQGDSDDASSVMSYGHFLNVAMNFDENVEVAPLPEFQKMHEYAIWYLRSLNPYTPVIHKSAFMELIWRIYYEKGFTPSSAEVVMVQMMLAILKYQISARNHDEAMMEESNKHYRYSLRFFKDLVASHTLQDVQAMTLICIHLRNFPKPGAAWIMSWMTFAIALEMGLHRSAKAWAETAPKRDLHEVELRKRVFWTIYGLNVGLSGKLGRPMPIRMEDVDVEFPEPLDDSLPQDGNLSNFHKCSFHVGIQAAKVTVLFGQMYSTVYAVRQPPHSYEETVRRLEEDIRRWQEELPVELSGVYRANQESYIFARYLEFWDQEFQLLLHHPAICRSTNADFMNSNLDICLDASSKMLHNVNELRKFKSLDIPWINCTVYIAAIFTTLFVYSQRKDSMASADMIKLRNDMDLWLDVMGECGELLVARAALNESPQQENNPASNVFGNTDSFHTQYSEPGASSNDAESKQPSYLPPDDPSMGPSNNPYPTVPSASEYSYSNGTSTSMPSYPSNANAFDQSNYAGVGEADMSAAHAAAIASAASAASATAPQPTGDSYMFATPSATNNTTSHYPAHGASHNDAWRQWTRAVMTPLGPQDYHRPQEYLNTANTLMSLGGRDGSAQVPGQDGAASVEGAAMQGQGQSNTSWPLMLFGIGPNGNIGGP